MPKKTVKKKKEKYIEAVGRRKTSTARVRIWSNSKPEFKVNGKNIDDYFPAEKLQKVAKEPFLKMNCLDKFKVSVLVKGGGISSQADAVRHSSARVLVKFNPDFRKRLRKVGFLTRDPRMRERKKFGLKRARRAPQWRKR